MKEFDELIKIAQDTLNPRQLSKLAEAGGVAAAILSDSGNVYTGVCVDTACSMGFCAEHAAAAAMIAAGENHFVRCVAVNWDGVVLSPCGRCREFLAQLHPDNLHAEIMIRTRPDDAGEMKVARLQELLPYRWC